ncbi:hypothetical protein JZ751_019305 [Albula glossodonta]|uniref:Neugrin n=1 Tax=Albula glossodonta TaxID=121402 RepID=A0A8T2N142_9TELE|nr:hypothetical protein JZ751_019305 [Albula glossodonta]
MTVTSLILRLLFLITTTIMFSQEKRRRGAVKLQRIKRQMTPPGPPERTLSWDAMEQIRFLRQESPEEWSVGRLAEGFSVSPDIVRRVLQSRFIPSAERRQKQDSRAWARAGQRSLPAHHSQERLELPGGAKANTMLPTGTGSMEANMLTAAKGSALPTLKMQMMEPGQDKVTVAPTAGSVVPASLTVLQSPWPPSSHSEKTTVQELHAERHPTSTGVQPHMQEEEWDGWVLSDEDLEELATALPAQNCQVVQKGREFFDKEGNFLYRI